MNKVFLLMLISALLVPLGLAQTPYAASNTDQANVAGCLGGSEGNYTVTEDGTGQIFKIATSSVDLKSHLGHDVKLMGRKASGAVSSAAADSSFAVTELNMISEHCAAAAAVPAATASPSSGNVSTPPAAATTPAVTASPSSETVSPPAADAPPPNAPAPAATVSTSSDTVSPQPAANAPAPAATVSPSSDTVSPQPANAAAPAATVSPSSATVSTPTADAAHTTGPSARSHRVSKTKPAAAAEPPATVSPSAETVSPPAADATTPAATASPSAETVSPTAPAATTPAVTHKGGSLWLLILVGVLVIALGTLAPMLSRWRKRKMLERTGTPNLSLTKEVSSDRDKPAPRKAA